MKKNRLPLHLGFWLAYVLYDGYLSAPLSGSSYGDMSMWQRFGIAYLGQLCLLTVKIPAVYLVLYRLLPQGFERKKMLVFGGQVLLVAAVSTALLQVLWYHFIMPDIYGIEPPGKPANGWLLALRWLYNSLDILFLFGIAIALKLFRLRQKTEERERLLIAEKLQSELQFLRAQTNPHFLFNTLNNLYHLARKGSGNTPEAILKLSGMLRFMLHECTSDRIPLSQEIAVIRDYLELERLRYDDRLQVRFEVEVEDEHALIAPLLLLPLVENAFKHGASESTGGAFVDIELRHRSGRLFFLVKKSVDGSQTDAKEGIGLKNLRRQLALQYPAHQLDIGRTGGVFSIKLEMDLMVAPI